MNETLAFYKQMDTCRRAYRSLAAAIRDVAVDPTDDVIDVGCGLGAIVEWFTEQGINCIGWDTPEARKYAYDAVTDRFLTIPLQTVSRRDVVICTETAEHVPPEHGEAFARDVARLAKRRLVWSAAPPGQEWEGHVNLKPAEYWLGILQREGLKVDLRATHSLRFLMRERHTQHEHCCHSFYCLTRPR